MSNQVRVGAYLVTRSGRTFYIIDRGTGECVDWHDDEHGAMAIANDLEREDRELHEHVAADQAELLGYLAGRKIGLEVK